MMTTCWRISALLKQCQHLSRPGEDPQTFHRLGEFHLRHAIILLRQAGRRGRRPHRLRSAHQARPIQPVARLRRYLEQQRMAARRRLDQAFPDDRHGVPRNAARLTYRLSARLPGSAQYHAEPLAEPGPEALLRFPALGRYADLGAVPDARLRAWPARQGSGAIFLTETGTLGKLYSEGLENIDNKPREGIKSTGAQTVLVHRYGIMPQIVPVFVSQTLYQWESNVRGATIIGAVGADAASASSCGRPCAPTPTGKTSPTWSF